MTGSRGQIWRILTPDIHILGAPENSERSSDFYSTLYISVCPLGKYYCSIRTMDDPQSHFGQRFRGKVALVTGASSGFGKAISLRLSCEGARICCVDVARVHSSYQNFTNADDSPTHELISQRGGTAIFFQADVTHGHAVEQAIAFAVQQYGALHIMINCAGICPEGNRDQLGQKIQDKDESIWDSTMAVNARSVFLGCKYAVRQFLRQECFPSGSRGWIVNVGSTASLVAHDIGLGVFAASQSAIH